MILDSSAVLAILLKEPDHQKILEKLLSADVVGIGAPTKVECTIVLGVRASIDASMLINNFLEEASVELIPFTHEHCSLAIGAYGRYGKGQHRAALNFGDCLAYAVAKFANQPLLFKGDDFAYTDVKVA